MPRLTKKISRGIIIAMKVVFKRNVDCDYFDRRMNESYPKYFRRWDEVKAEAVEQEGSMVNIALYDGDTIMGVPKSAVEIAK